MMNRADLLILSGFTCLILVIPLFVQNEYFLHLLILGAFFAQLAGYWNLLDGYLGLINFGYAAYIGIGAYTSALLAIHFELPIPVCMVLGGIAAGLLGILLIIPCLRMVTFSTAIVTLAFGEITRIAATAWTGLTKGEMGLWGIPPLFSSPKKLPFYYFAFGFLLLGTMVLRKILQSRLGLAIVAIREDEIAAATNGIETKRMKVLVSGISCFMAGVVGAFYAHYILTITPGLFGLGYTIQIMAMSMFGGKGTLVGPILGAFTLIFFSEAFRFMQDYRLIVYGLLIIGTVLAFPTGLIGAVRRVTGAFRSKEVI
ncbi:MAG: branched-chain amino acid ABC transporter permease [Thermodesulfobacteriota bacterium]